MVFDTKVGLRLRVPALMLVVYVRIPVMCLCARVHTQKVTTHVSVGNFEVSNPRAAKLSLLGVFGTKLQSFG